MTIEEFNNMSWGAGGKVIYDCNECDVISVNFAEALLGIDEFDDIDNLSWVRCENIEII